MTALRIGKLQFDSNLIQGPLAGISCSAMRVQTWKYSSPAYCSTEMISATHLAHASTPLRYSHREKSEGPLCVQFSAANPEDLAKAVRKISVIQPELIELNCGCPVNKIRRKGAGSRLLSETDALKQLCATLRENTEAAVSIKIRVSGDRDDQDDLLNAKIIEDSGADCIVVHGRHWTERYDVSCRRDQIARVVSAVKIPVIGNGDVQDAESLANMLKETGCAGVMIARASLGQPWLFSQLTDPTFQKPSLSEIGEIFIDHIRRLTLIDSEFHAVLQARKMAKYYLREFPGDKTEVLQHLMNCRDFSRFSKIIEDATS